MKIRSSYHLTIGYAKYNIWNLFLDTDTVIGYVLGTVGEVQAIATRSGFFCYCNAFAATATLPKASITVKKRTAAKPQDAPEKLVLQLRERLLAELDRTEQCEEFQSASSEHRVRVLTGIFKALQGVEEMMMRIGRDSKNKSGKGVNVVEFRRQLEEQIARLVEQEASEAVPGGTE